MTKKEDTSNIEPIKITAEQMSETFKDKTYVIIDVRQDYEYNKEHILDAVNIPLGEIETVTQKYAKDTNIILYCRSGNRSNQAALKLIELGYKNIYDLGGIDSINLPKASEEV
jgi:rhodanese-related sulfurtransferase